MGVNYEDADGRKDRHVLAVAVKPELLVRAQAIRLVGRTAVRLNLVSDIDFTGLHLDDRSETTRQDQVSALLSPIILSAQMSRNAILAGDFNATHAQDQLAPRLRSVAWAVNA